MTQTRFEEKEATRRITEDYVLRYGKRGCLDCALQSNDTLCENTDKECGVGNGGYYEVRASLSLTKELVQYLEGIDD
jgi:hypothetical protein